MADLGAIGKSPGYLPSTRAGLITGVVTASGSPVANRIIGVFKKQQVNWPFLDYSPTQAANNFPETPQLVRRTVTNANGEFGFHNLWELKDGEAYVVSTLQPGETITVDTPGPADPITAQLASASVELSHLGRNGAHLGNIQGDILDEDDNPVVGAVVALLKPSQIGWPFLDYSPTQATNNFVETPQVVRFTRTNSNGRYAFWNLRELPEGEFYVVANFDNYQVLVDGAEEGPETSTLMFLVM